jgi:hypothetical protein
VCLAVLLAGLTVLHRQTTTDAAEDKPTTEKLPTDLARVPVGAVGMFSVRLADVWTGALLKGMKEKGGKDLEKELEEEARKTGLTPDKVERVTGVALKPEGDQPLIFVGMKEAFDRTKVFSLMVPEGKEEKYMGETIVANERKAGYVLGEKAFVYGRKADIHALIDGGTEKTEGGLAPVLALAAKKHALVAGINPSALPPLPEELPAEAEVFKPLVKAKLATLIVDLDEKATGKMRVNFANAEEAGAGLKAVRAAQKLGLGLLDQGIEELSKDNAMKDAVGLIKSAQKSLKTATIEREGSTVVGHLDVEMNLSTLGAQLFEATQKVRDAAARLRSQNNLRQIAIAMHNYESVNGGLPAQAVYDKDGKALLSWRVMILPYIEQNELYKEFKLDEAWDSPHNKKLLAKMPNTYQAPTGKPQHLHGTFYQGFAGKGAFFEGKKGIRFADITDGTSNTIMIVEAGNDVPWTKPEDLPFVPDKPLPKRANMYLTPGFNAVFCDGAARFISDKVKDSSLQKIITRNGGEVLDAED